MERATQKDDRGYYLVGDGIYSDRGVPEKFRGDDVDRLAAYEDTDLEPEEVEQIRRAAEHMMFESVSHFVGYALSNFDELQKYKALGDYNRLRELDQEDREGGCVVLPCKVGDTLYRIQRFKRGKNWRKEAKFIRTVELNRNNLWRIVMDGEIGKTVFLTREEAEAALRREQDDN